MGSVGCECTAGGSCDTGLTCLSGLCVDADDGGGDGGGSGDAGDGGTGSTGATGDSGGGSGEETTNDGGMTSNGGSSSSSTSTSSSSSSSSSGGGGSVVFSESFLHNVDGTPQCEAWNTFRGQLPGRTYNRVTFSGSMNPTGYTCNGPTADTICQYLFTGGPAVVACDGNAWSIDGNCVAGFELNVGGPVCDCAYSDTLRPCAWVNEWGGFGNDSCDTPTQVMEVVCEY